MTRDIDSVLPACAYSEEVTIETSWREEHVVSGIQYGRSEWVTTIHDPVCERFEEEPYGTGNSIEESIIAAMRSYIVTRRAIDEGRYE